MVGKLPHELSAEELVASGMCPIKREYIKTAPQVKLLVEAVGPSQAGTTEPAQKRSKRQYKKDKKDGQKERMCYHFLTGTCNHGDTCKFHHDMDAYIKTRPPDMPGTCPFSCLPACPYGITCRWATTHANPDALTKTWLLDKLPAAAPDSTPATEALQGGDLPVSTAIDKPINELPHATQISLRAHRYVFHHADSVIKGMGIKSQLPQRYTVPSSHAHAATAGSAEQGGTPESARPAAGTPLDNMACADTGDAAGANAGAAEGAEEPTRMDVVADHAADMIGMGSTPAAAASTGLGPLPNDNLPSVGAAPEAGVPEAAAPDAGAPKAAAPGAADEERPAKRPRVFDAAASLVPIFDISKASNADGDLLWSDGKRRLDFRGKTYCAPLTTNGNLPFRRVVKGYGCDVTCGEMALATNLLQGQPSEWALLKRHACEDFFGVQICGGYADSISRCVQMLEEHIDTDFIDINMGCPIDMVCNKGAGSKLLLQPKRMEQIVRAAVRTARTCAITFKTRTAYYDKDRIAHTLLPAAADWGAAAVTLHGRTRQQRYSRLADWDYVEQTAAAVPEHMQVIGNGDICSWTDWNEHMKSGKLATCMVARGALIKPWVFTEIKEQRHWDITANERFDMLKQYCAFGLEHWGSDARGVENTRRFLLEWLSFLHRYVPVGLLEVLPQQMTWRPPAYVGRSDLETLLSSSNPADWVKISEMLLGPVPASFVFVPKHKSNAYTTTDADTGAGGKVQG